MFLPLVADIRVTFVLYAFITFLVSLTGFMIWYKMKKTKYNLKDVHKINIGSELTVQLN